MESLGASSKQPLEPGAACGPAGCMASGRNGFPSFYSSRSLGAAVCWPWPPPWRKALQHYQRRSAAACTAHVLCYRSTVRRLRVLGQHLLRSDLTRACNKPNCVITESGPGMCDGVSYAPLGPGKKVGIPPSKYICLQHTNSASTCDLQPP